ncbi:MAG TPA: 6-bladed beta-propeller [Gemmatimonadaceae bacterium]|nr:6-bladed beta-propeller [Gemmatimonadaceae bacterium]
MRRSPGAAIVLAASFLIAPVAALQLFAATAQPLGAQAPQLWLTQETRIDGNTELLSRFRTVVVASDGRMFIPDRDAMQLRIFAATGKAMGTFGRKGNGPGEFQDLGSAIGWHGDTLWIFDFNARRVTYVAPDMQVIRTVSTVAAAGTAPPAPDDEKRMPMTNMMADHVYRDGSYLTRKSFGPPDPATFYATDSRMIIIGPDGTIRREVGRLPPTAGRVFLQDPVGRGVFGADVPFASHSFQATSRDGNRVAFLSPATMSGSRGSYTLNIVSTTGDTALHRTFTFDGVRIPRARLDSALDAIPTQYRARNNSTVGPQMRDKARAVAPEYYAPVSALTFGDDDTIWLTVYESGPGVRARALDAKGNTIGEVLLPPRTIIARATRSKIWAIESDADDVQSVVVYRVVR